MTVHAVRRRAARGARIPSKGTRKTPELVRVAVSLPADDMALVTWLAKHKGVPVASVLRDAVWAYILPFKNNRALKEKISTDRR